MTSRLKPIDPLSERWQPTADPNDIVVPGLDTNAPVYDQIEQIEQLITIKLQVRAINILRRGRVLIWDSEHRCKLLKDATHHGQQDSTRREAVLGRDGTCEGSGKGT